MIHHFSPDGKRWFWGIGSRRQAFVGIFYGDGPIGLILFGHRIGKAWATVNDEPQEDGDDA